jgi:hypothetical protein
MPAGAHTLELRTAGDSDVLPPLWSSTILLQPADRVLLASVGHLADKAGPKKLDLIALPLGPADPQTVLLRLLHVSPSAPALEVADATAMFTLGGTGFTQMTPYIAASNQVDFAGPMDLSLSAASAKSTLATLSLLNTYHPGAVLTAVVFGEIDPLIDDAKFLGLSLLDEQSGQLSDLPLVINSEGPPATFYVFHAAPDAPAVDIVPADGLPLVENLAYQQASTLLSLPPGSYQVDVRPTGMSTALSSANLKLLPGTDWALFAAGLLTDPMPDRQLALHAAPRVPEVDEGSAGIWRMLHAVPDAGAFDLTAGSAPVFADLAYGQASPYSQEGLTATTLELGPSGDSGTTATWAIIVPQGVVDGLKGEVATLYLTGSSVASAQPFTAVAVVESSATSMQAPTLFPLQTTAFSANFKGR